MAWPCSISCNEAASSERNLQLAEKWLLLAAESGQPIAQYNLAMLYRTGGPGLMRNQLQAVRWSRRAADQGNAPAQLMMRIYCSDGDGVLKDDVEGYKWAALAGAGGDSRATRLLNAMAGQGQEPSRIVLELPKAGHTAAETAAAPDSFRGQQRWGEVQTNLPKGLAQHFLHEALFGAAFDQNQRAFHYGRAPSTFFSHNSPKP